MESAPTSNLPTVSPLSAGLGRIAKTLRLVMAASIAAVYSGCGEQPIHYIDYEKCNDDICLKCDDCREDDEEVLDEIFRLQADAYQCIARAMAYDPAKEAGEPVVTYNLDGLPKSGINFNYAGGVDVFYVAHLLKDVDDYTPMASVSNVLQEVHETGHAFTYLGLGDVPHWFNEGFSIFLEGTLKCDEQKQYASSRLSEASSNWKRLKMGLPIEHQGTSHMRGAMFVQALMDDYGWNIQKIELLWNELRQAHKNGQIIDTAFIIITAERMTGSSLSYLFETIGITYNPFN